MRSSPTASGGCSSSSSPVSYYAARIYLTNGPLSTEEGDVPAGKLGLVVSGPWEKGIYEDLDVVNHGRGAVRFNLEIATRSDFADLFEVKSPGSCAAGASRAAGIRRAASSGPPTRTTTSGGPSSSGWPTAARPLTTPTAASPSRSRSPRARPGTRAVTTCSASTTSPSRRSTAAITERRALARRAPAGVAGAGHQAHLGERGALPALPAIVRGPRRAPPPRARRGARRLGARRRGAVVRRALRPRQPDCQPADQAR